MLCNKMPAAESVGYLKEVSISNSSEMNRIKNSKDGCHTLHLFSQLSMLVMGCGEKELRA